MAFWDNKEIQMIEDEFDKWEDEKYKTLMYINI
jgi:hypothetical protein